MSEEEIEFWNSIFFHEIMFQEIKEEANRIYNGVDCGKIRQWVQSLDIPEFYEYSDKILEIVDKNRINNQKLEAAHTLEQGEISEQDQRSELTEEERWKLLKIRSARLFKLMNLNAPESIIAHAIDLIYKLRPEN